MVAAISVAVKLMSIPLALLATGWRRLATGRGALLELVIETDADPVSRQRLLRDLLRVADDPRVVGLLLRVRSAPAGWAACEDLRAVLGRLRARGVRTVAVLEAVGNLGYWIAAACDEVVMTPPDQLGLTGVGAELTFFARALDRLGATPDFQSAGAYKSFGEPFTRTHASAENVEAVDRMVSGLQHALLDGLCADRALDRGTLQRLMGSAPIDAIRAHEQRLVDHLFYDDQLEEWLDSEFGESTRRVSFERWSLRDRALDWARSLGSRGDVLAVLHLCGGIVMDDDSSRRLIRAREVVRKLKSLREDDRVKAVVLHVQSGGGSAVASDLMWREVSVLSEKKPVVASFSDVAASGGYYLAAPAEVIFARSTTLTGSIGVFGGKVVVGEGLRKLGVATQAIGASPNAFMFSASRAFTPAQRVQFRASLQRFYDGFVQRVASGRDRAVEVMEPHCRGRVWTGLDAHERGLVDEIGDLFQAVEGARVLADLQAKPYTRRDISLQPGSPVSRLVGMLFGKSVPMGARLWMDRIGAGGGTLELLEAHRGVPLAMMPFTVQIR